jgi:predicted nuclease with TOPRIM domain
LNELRQVLRKNDPVLFEINNLITALLPPEKVYALRLDNIHYLNEKLAKHLPALQKQLLEVQDSMVSVKVEKKRLKKRLKKEVKETVKKIVKETVNEKVDEKVKEKHKEKIKEKGKEKEIVTAAKEIVRAGYTETKKPKASIFRIFHHHIKLPRREEISKLNPLSGLGKRK